MGLQRAGVGGVRTLRSAGALADRVCLVRLSLPVTERLSRSTITLPISSVQTTEQTGFVVDSLRQGRCRGEIRKTRVGIFVPCRNEGVIIGETIRSPCLSESDEFPYEGVIIVVDDGSKDDTFGKATAGADVLYRHETNRGLGAATRAGMEIAHYVGCHAFAKFDADLQHDINDIAPSVRPLIDNQADMVTPPGSPARSTTECRSSGRLVIESSRC